MVEKLTKEEKCKITGEITLDLLMTECGGSEEALREFGKTMFGIELSNPVSRECELVLKDGLTKDTCYDFRAIRRWVLCKTWEIMEIERKSFRDSIREAWSRAKEECAKIGAYI